MPDVELVFLTADDSVIDLCRKYWQMDEKGNFGYSASQIASTLSVRSSALAGQIRLYCEARSTSIKCRNCGTPYIFPSRSDYSAAIKNLDRLKNQWICNTCQEKLRTMANEEAARKIAQKREIIKSTYNLGNRPHLTTSSLNMGQALNIACVVRLGASEDLSHVIPAKYWIADLAPTETFGYQLLKDLYHNRILYVHPASSVDAFIYEDQSISQIYLNSAQWALPIGTATEQDFVTELDERFRNMDWPESWSDQILPIWKTIALEECVQYLLMSMTEHKFSLKIGEKTRLVLQNALENFSVAQVYNFIWRAARDAAAYYVREKPPIQQAANSVVGNIQRNAERARAEGWEVKAYNRDRRCPQSKISEVFFNAILQIGDEGFYKVPSP